MSAFVQSFPCGANRGIPANLCPYKICSPRRVQTKRLSLRATLAGWAETRLAIPALTFVTDDAQAPNLAGVHFETPPSITANDLLNIVKGDTPDEWVNEILHTLLGWRKLDENTWNNDLVSREWKETYPDEPPNFIGIEGNYEPSIDRPVKYAVQKLARSIPMKYKPLLKEVMNPFGFSGWKIKDLTPNRTRRATAVSWILYWYRVHYPEYEWC